NSGSRIAHSASVTDDEYSAQPCPPAAWSGHDGHGEIVDGIVGSWSGRRLANHRPNQEPTSSVLREAHARRSRVLKHSLTALLYPRIGPSTAARRVLIIGDSTPATSSVTAIGSEDRDGCGPRRRRRPSRCRRACRRGWPRAGGGWAA